MTKIPNLNEILISTSVENQSSGSIENVDFLKAGNIWCHGVRLLPPGDILIHILHYCNTYNPFVTLLQVFNKYNCQCN